MTIIEKTLFLLFVYQNYLVQFTNNDKVQINNDKNIITIIYDHEETSNYDDYAIPVTFKVYGVYKNNDYIGSILIYNTREVGFVAE